MTYIVLVETLNPALSYRSSVGVPGTGWECAQCDVDVPGSAQSKW